MDEMVIAKIKITYLFLKFNCVIIKNKNNISKKKDALSPDRRIRKQVNKTIIRFM